MCSRGSSGSGSARAIAPTAQLYDDFPPHQSLFHKAEPVYEELDGWMEEIDEATSFEDLPKEARTYVQRLEELVGVPVSVVSIGPAREQSLPVG